MSDNLSFNIPKLNEVWEESNRYYNEYKEIITALELEIKKLETSWGKQDASLYTQFKEKYDEKKIRLQETETLMKELVDSLQEKKNAIEDATAATSSSFE